MLLSLLKAKAFNELSFNISAVACQVRGSTLNPVFDCESLEPRSIKQTDSNRRVLRPLIKLLAKECSKHFSVIQIR